MADTNKKPNKFGNIGKKIVKFFVDLKAEMKKVVWPDRKKLIQSTIAVVSICFIAALIVFTIDKILSTSLGAVGFYPKADSSEATNNPLPTLAPKVTSTVDPSGAASSTPTSTAASSILESSASTASSN